MSQRMIEQFMEMVTSEAYRAHMHFRTEALEDSRLVCMQPAG